MISRPFLKHPAYYDLLAALLGILIILVGGAGCDSQGSGRPPIEEQPEGLGKGTTRLSDSLPSTSSTPASQATETLPTIVAFGDSLTAGLGVPADQTYPAQLQQRLNALGYSYRVINAGVSGETTAGGLRRLEWILKYHPQIVILELGANDGLRGLPIEEIYTNLEQIIQRLRAEGIIVILAGMKLPPNYGQLYTTRFEALYKKLAVHYTVTFIPFFLEGVAGNPQLNQADGIHPTAQGYHIIVDHLMQVLEPLLRKSAHL
ncbi:MAG: arylesterase [Nitrospirae bacterium]|nr:MAG: arylesterase [Nitrospirota bacterium]